MLCTNCLFQSVREYGCTGGANRHSIKRGKYKRLTNTFALYYSSEYNGCSTCATTSMQQKHLVRSKPNFEPHDKVVKHTTIQASG